MQQNLSVMSQKDDAFEYVLNRIADRAVRRLGLDAGDPRYAFLLRNLLNSLCGPDGDEYIAAEMMSYLNEEGYDMEQEEVQRIVSEARVQCDPHVFALQTALNDIEESNLSGETAFDNIRGFLDRHEH